MSFFESLIKWINTNYRVGMDPLKIDEQLTKAADIKIHSNSFPENYVDDKQKFQFSCPISTTGNANSQLTQIIIQQIVLNSGKNFYLQNPQAKTLGFAFKLTKNTVSGLFILNLPARLQLQMNLQPRIIEAEEIPVQTNKEENTKEKAVAKKPIHSEPPKPSPTRKITFVPHVLDFILDREISFVYEELQNQLISQWKRKTEKELKIDQILLDQLIILHYKAAIEEKSVDSDYLAPITNNFENFRLITKKLDFQDSHDFKESKDELNEIAKNILSSFNEEEFQEFETIICSYVDFIGKPTAVIIIGKVKNDHTDSNISFTPTTEQFSNIILSNINTIRINRNLPRIKTFTLNAASEETLNKLDKSQLTLTRQTSNRTLESNKKGICFIYLVPADQSFAEIIKIIFDDRFERGCLGLFNNFGIAIQSVQVGETNCMLIGIAVLSSKFDKQ